MQNFFHQVKDSFIKSNKGEEDLKILIRYWGIIGYIFTYFILNKLIKTTSPFVSSTLSALCVIYFSWHLYAMFKCSPAKPKLSKEEKRELKQKQRKEFFSHLIKKILLQESFSKWDPIFITKLIDVFCIANFAGLFLK